MKGYKNCLIVAIIFTLAHGNRVQNPCEDGKIPCDNGECIERLGWCGKDYECSDQSDEKYCKRKSFFFLPDNKCNEKHFMCKDKTCIPASLRCDGVVDCHDHSDEHSCEIPDQDESVYSSEKEPEYVSSASKPTQKETEYVSTASTPTQKEPKSVSTARKPAQKEPDTTSNLKPTDGFNDNSRTDESYNNNRRHGYNPSPPNIDYSYASPPAHNYNSNQRIPYYLRYPENPYYPRLFLIIPYFPEQHYYPRYPGQPYDSRYPEQTYSDSRYPEQPSDSKYLGQNNRRDSDTPSVGNFTSIPPTRSKQDPISPGLPYWLSYIGREIPVQNPEKRDDVTVTNTGGGPVTIERNWLKLSFNF